VSNLWWKTGPYIFQKLLRSLNATVSNSDVLAESSQQVFCGRQKSGSRIFPGLNSNKWCARLSLS